jgi:protein-tyrosine-phosphatase
MRSDETSIICLLRTPTAAKWQAFTRIHGGPDVEAHSAGSSPSGRINPQAIESMGEVGYDLAAYRSKSLTEIPAIEYDFVATMGCGDACPLVRAKQCADWNIPDPRDMDGEEFRAARDLIEVRVRVALAFMLDGEAN